MLLVFAVFINFTAAVIPASGKLYPTTGAASNTCLKYTSSIFTTNDASLCHDFIFEPAGMVDLGAESVQAHFIKIGDGQCLQASRNGCTRGGACRPQPCDSTSASQKFVLAEDPVQGDIEIFGPTSDSCFGLNSRIHEMLESAPHGGCKNPNYGVSGPHDTTTLAGILACCNDVQGSWGPTSMTLVSTAGAVSAGDPHILRLDGTAFDIDTTGSYSLFNVAAGRQFSVKSMVAPENNGAAIGKYNMECEFGGSWLGGHNVTAVAAGGEGGMEAGIYFDGHFVSIPNLLKNTSQYTREFTGHSKMILEICQIANDMSDYCISTFSFRRQNKGNHTYMTMVTDAANITVRYTSIHFGHLDIYTTLQKDVDFAQIGGLLAGGKLQTRRGGSPLLAASVGAVHE